MARATERLKQAMEVCELGALTLPNQVDVLMDAARAILQEAPTLTPPNEPLTLDELREMDGEPEYIVFSPDADGEKLQFWALVAVDKWGEVYLMNNLGGSSAYEEAWANIEAIYRRPPVGEADA